MKLSFSIQCIMYLQFCPAIKKNMVNEVAKLLYHCTYP